MSGFDPTGEPTRFRYLSFTKNLEERPAQGRNFRGLGIMRIKSAKFLRPQRVPRLFSNGTHPWGVPGLAHTPPL